MRVASWVLLVCCMLLVVWSVFGVCRLLFVDGCSVCAAWYVLLGG